MSDPCFFTKLFLDEGSPYSYACEFDYSTFRVSDCEPDGKTAKISVLINPSLSVAITILALEKIVGDMDSYVRRRISALENTEMDDESLVRDCFIYIDLENQLT